jgi:hypothetical protein
MSKKIVKEKLDHMTVSKSDYETNKTTIDNMADSVTLDDTPTDLGESEEKFQDDDLFGDEEKAEREMNEEFDSLMNELSNKNAPVVDITENVNPRIKKQDLIEYLNRKNNVK